MHELTNMNRRRNMRTQRQSLPLFTCSVNNRRNVCPSFTLHYMADNEHLPGDELYMRSLLCSDSLAVLSSLTQYCLTSAFTWEPITVQYSWQPRFRCKVSEESSSGRRYDRVCEGHLFLYGRLNRSRFGGMIELARVQEICCGQMWEEIRESGVYCCCGR